jgi:hypothetical protein
MLAGFAGSAMSIIGGQPITGANMSADQAASIRFMAPDVFRALATYEQGFGCTIKRGNATRCTRRSGAPA